MPICIPVSPTSDHHHHGINGHKTTREGLDEIPVRPSIVLNDLKENKTTLLKASKTEGSSRLVVSETLTKMVGLSDIPALVSYPPSSVRDFLSTADWQASLDAWLVNIELRLRLQETAFSQLSEVSVGVPFLLSYLREHELHPATGLVTGSREAKLHRYSYFLLKRICLVPNHDISAPSLSQLIGGGSVVFSASGDWKGTLRQLWSTQAALFKKLIASLKADFVSAAVPVAREEGLVVSIARISSLMRCWPEVAATIMAGADYLDTMMTSYRSRGVTLQKLCTENIFYCLRNLMSDVTKHVPLLLDNLYHMKSEADRQTKTKANHSTLLSSLVCTTSFLRHLRSDLEVRKRGRELVDRLTSYKLDMSHLHPVVPRTRSRSRQAKGKARADPEDEMNIHKAAQTSQVHELFPHLSTPYILRLLDHFHEDVEAVVAALLEPDSLPATLQDPSADQPDHPTDTGVTDLVPRSTPPVWSRRQGAFDDDEFDKLQISAASIRRGKHDITISQPADGEEHARSKAAIMAALAAFDSDDDERDDTYDVADVGGAVDNTIDTDGRERPDPEKNEALLFDAWKGSPESFARDSKTRMSNLRQQLRRETAMSDEQIEGWAIMLKRDTKMESRLNQKYSTEKTLSQGGQRALQSTKWRPAEQISTENSDVDSGAEVSSDGRRVGQAGIRGQKTFFGRGRGGGTRDGGPVSSSLPDSNSSQRARKRKEQGRSRGGPNHNRREGRAKKIGRGMSGPVG